MAGRGSAPSWMITRSRRHPIPALRYVSITFLLPKSLGNSFQLIVTVYNIFFCAIYSKMPQEQSSPADYGLDHPSPMYEHHHLMSSRPCSQNSRMSVEMVVPLGPSNFHPSPAYVHTQQQQPQHMSQAKQVRLERFNSATGNTIGSRSSPEDFADIFSPLK